MSALTRHGIYAPLLLAAVIAGCGSSPDTHTRDDPGSIRVYCNKSSLRWNACYEKAANVCGKKGYQIVGEDDSAIPTTTANANEVAVIGGSLVIRCNQ